MLQVHLIHDNDMAYKKDNVLYNLPYASPKK